MPPVPPVIKPKNIRVIPNSKGFGIKGFIPICFISHFHIKKRVKMPNSRERNALSHQTPVRAKNDLPPTMPRPEDN